ncbi:MAG: ADP-ribosylglycohydrolase family protein, partial [Caldilineaceae bacterium]|nr:ADP-ribosylglycohydrolase family protein [Caldilineaceae bacterium]
YWRDFDQAVAQSGESSRTTHAAQECIGACRLFGAMQWRALNGASKTEILATPYPIGKLPTKLQAIADGNYLGKSVDDIRGSGYVVESLEAALWCFATTNSFRDAVLTAVNLGDDADTTAALCGQLAGAFYGADAIPVDWRAKVVMRAEIERLATKLSARL